MIAKQQTQHYKQAKQRHLDRLSTLVWHLTGQADLFTSAMRIALFEIWQDAQNVNLTQQDDCLYEIAIGACRQIWSQQDVGVCPTRQCKAQYVRRHVSQLPYRQAQLILMRYMEGLHKQDIANHFSWTSLEAGIALTQAVHCLKNLLVQECLTEPPHIINLKGPITSLGIEYVPTKRPA